MCGNDVEWVGEYEHRLLTSARRESGSRGIRQFFVCYLRECNNLFWHAFLFFFFFWLMLR